jgi:hypothetical protein
VRSGVEVEGVAAGALGAAGLKGREEDRGLLGSGLSESMSTAVAASLVVRSSASVGGGA